MITLTLLPNDSQVPGHHEHRHLSDISFSSTIMSRQLIFVLNGALQNTAILITVKQIGRPLNCVKRRVDVEHKLLKNQQTTSFNV